jgi:hypothetical protein
MDMEKYTTPGWTLECTEAEHLAWLNYAPNEADNQGIGEIDCTGMSRDNFIALLRRQRSTTRTRLRISSGRAIAGVEARRRVQPS